MEDVSNAGMFFSFVLAAWLLSTPFCAYRHGGTAILWLSPLGPFGLLILFAINIYSRYAPLRPAEVVTTINKIGRLYLPTSNLFAIVVWMLWESNK